MRDNKIQQILSKEIARQREEHNFIASENFASNAVMSFCGSEFTNKYAEGYPGKRYYNGCEYVDVAEDLAIERLKNYLIVNLQMLNLILEHRLMGRVFLALLNPGDTIHGNEFKLWWSHYPWIKNFNVR